jgi:hypothetical protein
MNLIWRRIFRLQKKQLLTEPQLAVNCWRYTLGRQAAVRVQNAGKTLDSTQAKTWPTKEDNSYEDETLSA